MISEIIGAVLQVLVFTLIPFFIYIIKSKTTKGFLKYIGLQKSTKRANFLALLTCLIFAAPTLILVATNSEIREIMFDPNSITGKFRIMGFGINAVAILLVIALLKTSLAEEILFRGFIAKRLIKKLGYQKGNIIQAILFGIIHTVLFATITANIGFLILIFILPAVSSYITVYLNEKIANGSIIPGWISHGLGNVLAYSIVGFMI